jgi:hypothetical protein
MNDFEQMASSGPPSCHEILFQHLGNPILISEFKDEPDAAVSLEGSNLLYSDPLPFKQLDTLMCGWEG